MPVKNIPNSINRKYSIQFSTPTQDINNIDTALKYLNQNHSYIIIPGIQNTSLLDPQSLLLQILPHTNNSIVDITMPYIEVTKKKTIIKHLARYIICDQQLVGIRVKPSDSWPKSKTIKIQISPNIENFYQKRQLTSYFRQILVGDFIIQTNHLKIAPLFTSELSSVMQSTTINLLNDYYNLGCQIFSIVNDLSEQKKKSVKDPLDILRNYRRDGTIVVHCGMHISVDPSQVYKTKSLAMQTQQRLKKINITKLNQTYTDQFVIDLNLTKKNRKPNSYDLIKLHSLDIQYLDCTKFRIKLCFAPIKFNVLGKFQQEPMDIQQEYNQIKIKQNDFLLYLWNLFVNVNKRNPFHLPCPMNTKDQILLKQIIKLSTKSNLNPQDLVCFIKLDPKAKLPKIYEDMNFTTFNLQKLQKYQGFCAIYFPLKQRLLSNNIHKTDIFIAEAQKKVINCSGCISQQIFKHIQNQQIPQAANVADEDQKLVEKFLKRRLGASLQLFYFQMARYYPRNKLTPQFIQKMYEYLKIKSKKQFQATPFQVYILQTTFQQIKHIFAQSQQKFFFKGVGIKNQQDPAHGDQNQPQQNEFRKLINKVAYHCQAQKKNNYECHICSGLFHKKQKGTWGRLCLGCANFVCYSCFDKKTGQIAQSQESFQQCLICQNKCDCQKCMKKRYKSQSYNNIMPQRSSFFRQQHSFGNSIQNIRTNNQENNTNQQKNFNSNLIKSQFNIKSSVSKSIINDENINQLQKIPVECCWQCQLHNRVQRNIKFQCANCKNMKCLSCQKAQNTNRKWVLRGNILCHECFQKQRITIHQQNQIKLLRNKLMALEHQLTFSKRQKFFTNNLTNMAVPQSTNFTGFQIVQQINQNQHQSESNHQQKTQKGGTTPIFDHASSANKGSESPIGFSAKNNSSQNGSIASFGGNKNEQNKQSKRKNSSNSSRSNSVASNKNVQKKKENNNKKRVNSSGSQKSSRSNKKVNNKTNAKNNKREKSNSSKGSKTSAKKSNKRGSSVQSGQYQDSSQSQPKQQKRNWNNNHHKNTENPNNSYDMNRGGFKGQRNDRDQRGGRGGRGRGGNRQFNDNDRGGNNRFDNNRQRDDFKRNDNGFGGQNNRFRNDNSNDGGRGYDRNKSNNFNNDYSDRNNNKRNDYNNNNYNNNNYNNNNYNNNDYNKRNQRQNQQQKREGLIFDGGNKTNNSNQDQGDFEY